jgi:hypothetical protein
MILLDANLLIYSYQTSSPFHEATQKWFNRIVATEPAIGLPWISLLAFLRITTHPRLSLPGAFELAVTVVDDWLALPNVQLVQPGQRHWSILKRISVDGQARGALLTDAALAALAIEYGATLCSNDRGFTRFPGLQILNPLAT